MDRPLNRQPDVFTPLPCLDPDGRVAAWVCCRPCGYNLNGLAASGNCPECGKAIVHSTVPSLVRSMPAAWLSRVRHAAGLARMSIGALFLLVAAVPVSFSVLGPIGLPGILVVAAIFCIAAAGFLLASGDESALPKDLRDARVAFTESLVIAPVLVPFFIVLAAMLIPAVSSHPSAVADPRGILALFGLLACTFLIWLTINIALRPVSTFTRFMVRVFEGGPPMNQERSSPVLTLAKSAAVLLAAAGVCFVVSAHARGTIVSEVAAQFAALFSFVAGLVVIIALAWLYWILGGVRTALSSAIMEARIREQGDAAGDGT